MSQPSNDAPIARDLLAWFAQARRDLPWRRTRDPYRIWVSEIMLAQTQVARVLDYYERFLERFPTVEALAAAPLDAVLKAWEGLGYYARARNLQRAAQVLVAQHDGCLPADPRALRALPGVGEYTAGAIASIAFGRDVAALDSNVRRVFARLYRLRAPTPAELRRLVAAALPRGRAGEFNQALMDLGAMVCTPRRPHCTRCPLACHCQAFRQGDAAQFPAPRRRAPRPHYDVCAAVVEQEGRLLVAQRPADGLLGGLWEFPGGRRRPGETLEACLEREMREQAGLVVVVGERVATVEHGYSHFSITLHAYRCRLQAGQPPVPGVAGWRWLRPEELDHLAFSAASRRVIAALVDGHQPAGAAG